MKLDIQDTFNHELKPDPDLSNNRRQVKEAAFSYVEPAKPSNPQLIHVSESMLEELNISGEDSLTDEFVQIFSGMRILKGTHPYSMCYGGHQFGHWAGQLGDGRAINLFELVENGKRCALQLKGAGPTPYSRMGDGFAVLRSSIREHLCSEAMYHLGVPTTRSLCLMLSGDDVLRDIMYDGNPAYEKGAIICRVAPNFIRFGNFQMFTSRNDLENLRQLADYSIRHFFPNLKERGDDKYISFFKEVSILTLRMIIHWERVGFVHGVMNTDNMSILGLTIDYGPYGWLEDYDPNWTPNTTDASHRRYRFGAQAQMSLWNLAQFGNALVPLCKDVQALKEILEEYAQNYEKSHYEMMLNKIGLPPLKEHFELIDLMEQLLYRSEMDMTMFFRELSHFKMDDAGHFHSRLRDISYSAEFRLHATSWESWLRTYSELLHTVKSEDTQRKEEMNRVNPKYVLRNYMAQLAIDAAEEGNYSILEELYQVLKNPYTEQSNGNKWYAKRPDWAREKVGSSMLSCSS